MIVRVEGLRRLSAEVRSFGNARRRWTTRTAALLVLVDGRGRRGVGEVAPLPGYSPDHLEDAEGALRGWTRDLDLHEDDDLRAAVESIDVRLPSARFGLEMALLDLRSGGTLGAEVLRTGGVCLPAAPGPGSVSNAALVSSVDGARAAHRGGARGFKVKIGIDERAESTLVQGLRETFPGACLRLDANGTLDGETFRRWEERARHGGVEYIEEPLSPDALLSLDRADPSGGQGPALAIALDESLGDPRREDLLRHLRAIGRRPVMILKPVILGGLEACRSIARAHPAVPPILSHGFGGPLELHFASDLARELHPEGIHGLHPHAGLDLWKGVTVP
ncbi:MAG: o-succinylbenzoate synthase [Myxococcales bacterium]|nr:o-succinylbenzoate synthase [Myxococcales bacterium]